MLISRQRPELRGRNPTPGGVSYVALDRDSVANAVAAANAGDTIYLAAGEATWTNKVDITKPLRIIGAGAGVTTLTSNYTSSLYGLFNIVPTVAQSGLYRISGFSFAQAGKSYSVSGYVTFSDALAFRFDHNSVVTGAKRALYLKGQFYGCVDSNTFDCSGNGSALVTRGYLDDYPATIWGVAPTAYGAETNIYFEDNTLTANDLPIASGQGGRYVARYNDISGGAGTLATKFDVHGNQPTSGAAAMVHEIYGNDLSLGSANGYMIDHRGGKCLMFANEATGGASLLTGKCREEYADDINGSIYTMHVQDTYFWMNFCNGTLKHLIETADLTPGVIAENAEYFNQAAAFDGSAGIGVGTLASRPASGSTVGVGYWATDQDVADLTGMVGVSPATPLSGTLYRWNGSSWVSYYTPYEYPHPYRSL